MAFEVVHGVGIGCLNLATTLLQRLRQSDPTAGPREEPPDPHSLTGLLRCALLRNPLFEYLHVAAFEGLHPRVVAAWLENQRACEVQVHRM